MFRVGDPEPYSGRVLASCADCDAALITVEDDSFWADAQAVVWGKLPHLQASVAAVGFPQGGGSFCITSGVVSRWAQRQAAAGEMAAASPGPAARHPPHRLALACRTTPRT